MLSIVDFTLSTWYSDHGQNPGKVLDEWASSVFLDDLGLSPFLETSPCNIDPSFVYANSEGWTNGKFIIHLTISAMIVNNILLYVMNINKDIFAFYWLRFVM
jgi:hypothetical protein